MKRKDTRKLLCLVICCSACLALAVVLAGCGGGTDEGSSEGSEGSEDSEAVEVEETDVVEEEEETGTQTMWQGVVELNKNDIIIEGAEDYLGRDLYANLDIEGYGSVRIDLDSESAPITVANFCALAEHGYYNGLKFYRVVEDFCLQGGTKGNSASGSDDELYSIKGEFSENGVDNELADNFEYGTVAMARSSDMDSATSTFFICLDRKGTSLDSLNGQYAAFGTISNVNEMRTVIMAMVNDVVDKTGDSDMGIIQKKSDMPVIMNISIADVLDNDDNEEESEE